MRRRELPIDAHFLGLNIHPDAYQALKELATRNKVTVSWYVRAIITDALVEEGFDERRFRPEGNSQGREAGQANGAAAQ